MTNLRKTSKCCLFVDESQKTDFVYLFNYFFKGSLNDVHKFTVLNSNLMIDANCTKIKQLFIMFKCILLYVVCPFRTWPDRAVHNFLNFEAFSKVYLLNVLDPFLIFIFASSLGSLPSTFLLSLLSSICLEHAFNMSPINVHGVFLILSIELHFVSLFLKNSTLLA